MKHNEQGQKTRIYTFGEFRLDVPRRRLFRGGELLALTPKVFDTLVYLVEHRGTILTTDELLTALWPEVVVEENNLGQNISKLRSLLGEAPGENRHIATVPGHGYRFVAAVSEITDEGITESAVSNPGRTEPLVPAQVEGPRASSVRNRRTAAVAAISVVMAIAAAYFLWPDRARLGQNPTLASIAVLPFKPLVADSRDPALELGMADSLISRLSGIRNLTVAPLGVVRKYGTPGQDPVAAGRELGVEAVLDGHVHRVADRIRVTARLVRVADEQQLWAGQFDEPFTNIFGVQDAISDRVTRELEIELTGTERDRFTRRHTEDAEAYALYLKGRFFMDLAQPLPAIDLFQSAIRRDPRFALAYAGLADIYSRLPIATDARSFEPIARARAVAGAAMKIDDRLPETFAALGWIDFYFNWDWGASEANYLRALELNANDFSARLGLAHLLSITGRHDGALREVDRALAIEPRSPIAATFKGQFLLHARRYDEADAQLQSTLQSHPTFWIALLHRGRLHQLAGRPDKALAAFRRAKEAGGSWTPVAFAGYTSAVAGDRAAAGRALHELQAADGAYVPPYLVALVHQGLGDTSRALEWLEKAYTDRDVRMVFLGVDPAWDSLRTDLRFLALLKRLNLSA